MNPNRYPDCPDDGLLQDTAAGLSSPESRAHLLQHAAQCDHCGPLLSSYLEEFSEELSPEIEAVLQKSLTSQPGWQRRTVGKLLQERQGRERRSWNPIPLFTGSWPRAVGWAAAAAVVVATVLNGPALMAQWQLYRAKTLLAAAFAKQRTIEFRLTGVGFGKYQPAIKTLGESGGNDSPELLEAKLKVRREEELQSGGSLASPWEQIKGRVALLDSGDARKAEKAFEEAQAKGLNDPSLEIDLAASYFESDLHSGESQAPAPNLSRTIDLLNKVRKDARLSQEQKSVALFDLAIAYQKSNMLDLAVTTWNDYLAVDTDPSSPWHKEALARLEQAKAQMPPPNSGAFKEPSYFLQHSSDPKLQGDLEQYQDFAFAAWLPQAIEEPGSAPAQALPVMARLMEQQHADTWWRDFLRATGKADLPAVRAFTRAFVADHNDLHDQSLRESRTAAVLFARHHNVPGELMARFQEVYALQRIPSGAECLARAGRLWTALLKTDYRWLQGQAALEKATCANLVSGFQASDVYLETSRQLANGFDFPELRLRTIGLGASMFRLQKNDDSAWKNAVGGLRLYWQGSYSTERLYQFYTVMRQCAQDTSAVHAAEPLLRRSIDLLAPEDAKLHVVLRLQLANLLLEQGDEKAAEAEAEAVRRQLLQWTPDGPGVQTYLTAARIRLAEFQLRRGQAQLALPVLEPMRGHLPPGDDFVRLDFYRVLGSANLQLSQLDAASGAFAQGTHIAARPLQHFRDDASRLAWIRATDEIYRGIVQVLLAKKQDEKALAMWEWSKGRSLAKGSLAPPETLVRDDVLDSRKMQSSRMQAPRLVYASFSDRLQVWTTEGGHIHSRSIAVKQADLRRMVRDFTKSSSTPDDSQFQQFERQSQDLYALLLQPVVADLPSAQTATIELDEALSNLVVEALRSPDGRYFGEEYALIYSPGMRAEDTLRRPQPLRPQDQLLAVDVSGPGRDYLPGHEIATAAVQRFHPNTLLLSAGAASPGTVAQALPHSAAFHFFGHARRDGTGMVLELSNGSLLRSQDFSPRRLGRMQMAVLAACSSGLAENGLLDSSNLVRPFLAGGVPTVLSSHWNVDSQSTGELMRSFYLHLASEPPAQALRDARREMRLAKPHPYYWAAVSLTGKSI